MAAISAEASRRLSRGRPRLDRLGRQDQGPARRHAPRVARQAERSGRRPVHVGLGRHAQGRGAVPPQYPRQRRTGLARVDANANDKVFNVLPVFHSFGLTGGMMMPLLAGIPIYMYPSPLHYRIVPELIYQTGATILFGTDTFLTGYARSAHAYDFRTLRLDDRRRRGGQGSHTAGLHGAFGVRILEGYGVTETAPVLAMNTPIANRPARLAACRRYGSRLEPVPGIEEGGRLFVRGPNVMLGYLRAENPGVLEPLPRAGTTPATSSPSTRPASSPSRAAPSALPRSPAKWCRCPRSSDGGDAVAAGRLGRRIDPGSAKGRTHRVVRPQRRLPSADAMQGQAKAIRRPPS